MEEQQQRIATTSAPRPARPIPLPREAVEWVRVAKLGNVETLTKPDDPVTKTKAVKGITTFKGLHISSILGVFRDAKVANEWVDLLKSMKEYPYEQKQCTSESPFVSSMSTVEGDAMQDIEVINQVYAFPWPIQARDFVLLRQFNFRNETRDVEVYYESIEDSRIPVKEEYIRGTNIYSRFYFRAEGDNTYCEVETQVDLKGTLPSSVINLIQKFWPMKTLGALEKIARKGTVAPLSRVAAW